MTGQFTIDEEELKYIVRSARDLSEYYVRNARPVRPGSLWHRIINPKGYELETGRKHYGREQDE